MKNNITSAVVFPKLRGMIESDIEILNNLKHNYNNDEGAYEMLSSLVNAKREILDFFPENPEGIGGAATTPQEFKMASYGQKSAPDASNLSAMLLEIETAQMKFVKQNIGDKGIPDEMNKTLRKILEIYSDIVEQLGRSNKTSQNNMIII